MLLYKYIKYNIDYCKNYGIYILHYAQNLESIYKTINYSLDQENEFNFFEFIY